MIQPPPATDPRIVALVTAAQGGPAAGLSLAALDVVYKTTGADGVVAAPAGTIELVGGPGIVETLVAAGLLVSDGDRLVVPGEDVARGSAESLPEAVREECHRLVERRRWQKRGYSRSPGGNAPAKPKATQPEKGVRKYIEYGPLPFTLCDRRVTLHKNQADNNFFVQMQIERGRLQASVDKVAPGDLRGVAEALVSAAFRHSRQKGSTSPSAESIRVAAKATPATPKDAPSVANWEIYGEAIREGRDPCTGDTGDTGAVPFSPPKTDPKTHCTGAVNQNISRENGHFSGPSPDCTGVSGAVPLKKELKKEHSLPSEEGAPEGIRVDPGEPIRPPRAAGPRTASPAMVGEAVAAAGVPEEHRGVSVSAVMGYMADPKQGLSDWKLDTDKDRSKRNAFDAAVAAGLLDIVTIQSGHDEKGDPGRKRNGYVLTEKLLAVVESVRERIAAGDDVPAVVE